MKALIAEDNADDRKILRMNLEHHGCVVFEAGDGVEALRIAKERKPTLIISDALMPNMDGFQLLRALKLDDTLRDIPFLFYSAVYIGRREAELALSLGAAAFIIKPKEPEELWSEIKSLLDACELRDKKKINARFVPEDEVFLREYSSVIAVRLEKKVAELEAAKAVIEAKEQEWQTTFDAIDDCVTIHDRDFKITLANEGCEKMFGISKAEIRSRKCHELFHGKSSPVEACPRMIVEKSKGPAETEFFEAALNKWLSVACFPLLDAAGELRGVVHFARDISERKEMEEALKASEEKYRALVEHSLVGVYQSTVEGRFTYVNSAMARIYEFETAGEMMAASAFSLYKTPDDRARMLKQLQATGRIEDYELEGPTKKGNLKTVRVCSTLRDRIISGVVIDITEQKKIERQFLQAQKMEAIGQLAGGVAHDFNNILSAIIGYGHVALMKMTKDDPQRLNIDHMLEAADRAAHLTKDLLLFSRKQNSERKAVDLNEVVRNVEKFLNRIIGEDVECITRLHHGPVPVSADRHQIGQVLMNLATNARDAMPGGGAFTVSTEQIVLNTDFVAAHGYGRPGAYALLTVSDAGAGMDEETRTHIFEPFFTTKEVGKGTGLGLAVVYGIVKQHDGFINVYSEPGRGTTFRLYLPIIARDAMEEAGPIAEEAPARGTETILLAEDDESLRKLSRTVLTEYGYRVIEAVDGEDAVKKFEENKDEIQLLLFDLVMPKKSGQEAYDEIRKRKPDLSIIFASGYAPDIVRQKVSIDKSAHLVYKPLSPMALLRMVRKVLDGKAI